jgi:hypothetical protein
MLKRALMILVLVLAACGDGRDDEVMAEPTPTAVPEPTPFALLPCIPQGTYVDADVYRLSFVPGAICCDGTQPEFIPGVPRVGIQPRLVCANAPQG